MLRTYFLKNIITDGTKQPVGSIFIHDAILTSDEFGSGLKKLIQNTTETEHVGLSSLAEEWRIANEDEVKQIANLITEDPANKATRLAKAKAIIDNLPSRAAMLAAIDKVTTDVTAATTLAMVKPAILALVVIIRKGFQVLYWVAKGTEV